MNLLQIGKNGQRKLKMSQNEELIYYSLHPTDRFNDDVKYYIKSKKFTRLPKDIEDIKNDLINGIFKGKIIGDLDLDENTVAYKIRAKNSNTNVGKSNGYRLIYLVEKNGGGADKLLGKGDMLYAPIDYPEPKRIQGAFVSNDEVKAIVEFVKNNNKSYFDESVSQTINQKILYLKTPPNTWGLLLCLELRLGFRYRIRIIIGEFSNYCIKIM